MPIDLWTDQQDYTFEQVLSASDLNTYLANATTALKKALVADESASLAHRHKTGTLAARPAPGNAGRIYVPTDLPVMLVDDGTEWLIPTSGHHKAATLYEEMAGAPPAGGDRSTWLSATSGSGAVSGSAGADDTVWELSTGASGGSVARISSDGPGNKNFLPTRKLLIVVRLTLLDPTVAGQVAWAGLVSADGDAPADAIFVRKNGSGNVFGVVRSGGVDRLTADFGTTGSGLFTAIFEHDGTDIKVYKDTFNAAGLLGTLSANKPTVRMFAGFRISSVNAGAQRMRPDMALVHIAR